MGWFVVAGLVTAVVADAVVVDLASSVARLLEKCLQREVVGLVVLPEKMKILGKDSRQCSCLPPPCHQTQTPFLR